MKKRKSEKLCELCNMLKAWRHAEKAHAAAVLCAAHPLEIKTRSDTEAYLLRELRLLVDSEPWGEIWTS